MNRVNGYYQRPMPAAQPARAYAAPTAGGANAVSVFGVENYPKTAAEIATVARPTVPGAIAGFKGQFAASRAQSLFTQADRSRRFGPRIQKVRAGRQLLTKGVASGIRSSLIFGGLFSLVANGVKIAKGELSVPKGGAAIAGDLAATAVAGTAASLVSTFGGAMLATSLGPGFGLTLLGLGLGVGTFMGVDFLVRRLSMHQRLEAATERMLTDVVA